MSLSDIMSAAGLTSYAEVALVIFFVIFLGITAYVFLRKKGAWEHERHLPLQDDTPNPTAEELKR